MLILEPAPRQLLDYVSPSHRVAQSGCGSFIEVTHHVFPESGPANPWQYFKRAAKATTQTD